MLVCCSVLQYAPLSTCLEHLLDADVSIDLRHIRFYNCVAVCCNVLQCDAVCCSGLQCVAVCLGKRKREIDREREREILRLRDREKESYNERDR